MRVMEKKHVLIVGGGVAGLSAAVALADSGMEVDIVEASPFAGGHAVTYTCKATDRCVSCGACMVEEKLARAAEHPCIHIRVGSQVDGLSRGERFSVTLRTRPAFIDPLRCNGCGACWNACDTEGAVIRGSSGSQHPFYAISPAKCNHTAPPGCTRCRDACPENAIDLDARETVGEARADAVILAAGFASFDPREKPYGYGTIDNVVTHLEMEHMLRCHGGARKPSDGAEARRIAFVQCVGSRDAACNHIWCSRVCCGSALRMARLIKSGQPEAEITVFYIDFQNVGRDAERFIAEVRNAFRLIRAIPGDVYPDGQHHVMATFLDTATGETLQESFDLLVLSVGMVPPPALKETAQMFAVPLAPTGFAQTPLAADGVFTAGAVNGPMSIPEAIASGEQAAWNVIDLLDR